MIDSCKACNGTRKVRISITGGRLKRRCTLCAEVKLQPINRKNDYSRIIEASKMAGRIIMAFIAGIGAVLYIVMLVAGGIQSSNRNGRCEVSRHNRRSLL